MKRAVLVAVMLTTSVAAGDSTDPLEVHAQGDEPDGYVAAGLVWDQSQGFASRGPILEIGKRIGRAAWFARGMGQAGAIDRSDEPGQGTFLELRGGLEGRSCGAGGMLCGSAGLDLGFHSGEFQHVIYAPDGSHREFSQRLDAFVAVPRLTLDAGGRVRFRGVLELPVQMRAADSPTTTAAARGATMPTEGSDRFGVGFAISIALAVGF